MLSVLLLARRYRPRQVLSFFFVRCHAWRWQNRNDWVLYFYLSFCFVLQFELMASHARLEGIGGIFVLGVQENRRSRLAHLQGRKRITERFQLFIMPHLYESRIWANGLEFVMFSRRRIGRLRYRWAWGLLYYSFPVGFFFVSYLSFSLFAFVLLYFLFPLLCASVVCLFTILMFRVCNLYIWCIVSN